LPWRSHVRRAQRNGTAAPQSPFGAGIFYRGAANHCVVRWRSTSLFNVRKIQMQILESACECPICAIDADFRYIFIMPIHRESHQSPPTSPGLRNCKGERHHDKNKAPWFRNLTGQPWWRFRNFRISTIWSMYLNVPRALLPSYAPSHFTPTILEPSTSIE